MCVTAHCYISPFLVRFTKHMRSPSLGIFSGHDVLSGFFAMVGAPIVAEMQRQEQPRRKARRPVQAVDALVGGVPGCVEADVRLPFPRCRSVEY